MFVYYICFYFDLIIVLYSLLMYFWNNIDVCLLLCYRTFWDGLPFSIVLYASVRSVNRSCWVDCKWVHLLGNFSPMTSHVCNTSSGGSSRICSMAHMSQVLDLNVFNKPLNISLFSWNFFPTFSHLENVQYFQFNSYYHNSYIHVTLWCDLILYVNFLIVCHIFE